MKAAVFEADGLSKTYGLTKALGISEKIEIPRGKFVCVLGHSGSGKSTLLNLLALLEDQDRIPRSSSIRIRVNRWIIRPSANRKSKIRNAL